MSLPRRIEQKENEQGFLQEIPHSVLLENAFREISLELDGNGFTPQLDELRKKHFDILRFHWQKVLQTYALECEKKGIENFSGAEIQIGEKSVIVNAIDSGYIEDGIRLDIERRNLTETDSLSLIANSRGEIDEIFSPEIHSDIRGDDTEISYVFRFLGNKISYLRRDLLRTGIAQDERTVQFTRYAPDFI